MIDVLGDTGLEPVTSCVSSTFAQCPQSRNLVLKHTTGGNGLQVVQRVPVISPGFVYRIRLRHPDQGSGLVRRTSRFVRRPPGELAGLTSRPPRHEDGSSVRKPSVSISRLNAARSSGWCGLKCVLSSQW